MQIEVITTYYFKDGLNVELIHYSNNRYAAEKAMFNAYRRTSSDLSHTGGNKKMPGKTYVTFDGRSYH